MVRKKKKALEPEEEPQIEEENAEEAVCEEVIPESPEPLDTAEASIEEPEEEPVLATQPVAETEEPVKAEEDPRYTLLKDSLKGLLDTAPAFEKVKDNPWLYLEWRTQVKGLVQ